MTYYKVDMTNERSSSEINDFHYGDECADGIDKYGDLDLTDIKTLLAKLRFTSTRGTRIEVNRIPYNP